MRKRAVLFYHALQRAETLGDGSSIYHARRYGAAKRGGMCRAGVSNDISGGTWRVTARKRSKRENSLSISSSIWQQRQMATPRALAAWQHNALAVMSICAAHVRMLRCITTPRASQYRGAQQA